MIITIDISQIVYQTGVSRYTRELVKHLLKVDHKNDYKLFAGVFKQRQSVTDFFQELDANGLKYTPYIKIFPPKLASIIWNQLRLFPIEQFVGQTDILHTSDWTQPLTKAKKITTIHDLTPIKFPQWHEYKLVSNFKQNLKLTIKESERIITVSQNTKNDLIDYVDKSESFTRILPDEKVTVVYNAADPLFHPIEDKQKIAEVRQRFGISQKYILAVGTREPRKNLERIVEAFKSAKLHPHQLVIAGRYGWGQDLKQSSDIIITGYVNDADLPALYSGATTFIYPSLYEGFGLPVLEAMQCGCPTITSNTSSLPEVGGEACEYVNPEDLDEITTTLHKVVGNDAIRGRLKRDGLIQAKKFSWIETAKDTLKEYRKLQ